MFEIRPVILSLIALFFLLLGIALGHGATKNVWKAKLAVVEANHAKQLKAISDQATQQANAALKAQQAMQAASAELDRKYTKELNDEKAINARLRADPAVRLRVAGACQPARTQRLPQESSAPGVDDGTVELAQSARQAYFDLRDAVSLDARKIGALQEYVTAVCLATPP